MNPTTTHTYAEDLLAFLDAGVTPYHAVAAVRSRLLPHGYAELREGDSWRLEKGGRYFVTRNNSAIVAFAVGDGCPAENGFRLVGAHTDAPSFKIKPGGCLATPDGYLKLNVEGYGGGILSTWLDRPLSVAGRVALRSPAAARPGQTLVDLRRPVAVIPNLCIHFNRAANDGYAYNRQIDMLPLLGLAAGNGGDRFRLDELIASELGVDRGDILEHDLFLYESAPACLMGDGGGILSAGRIDNLGLVHAGLRGLLEAESGKGIAVLAAFDNEEVGSATGPGADSCLLPRVLRRICLGLGLDDEGSCRAAANSLAVSADAAHAVHPNHPDRHDPLNRPVLGGGPAVKYSASQRYATTALSAAVFLRVCEEAGVPCQKYVNRSDIVGGSTIGPLLSRLTGIDTVDVGAPILAMHSIRELGHAGDFRDAARAFAGFLGA